MKGHNVNTEERHGGVIMNAEYLLSDGHDIEDLRDEELVALFVEDRNEDAFNELINRYSDKVYRLAYRLTSDPKDAEEVLQEVFIILSEKLSSFRSEAKFSTWLYRVASNAAYMFLRNSSRYRDRNISLEDYKPYNDYGMIEGVREKDFSDAPDSKLLGREGAELIDKAIQELPPDYRIVFHMKDVEGMTSKEIAEALGLTVPAVKSRALRARLFLRDKLSDYFYEWRNK